MFDILCITPNPALDRSITVPALTPGAVLRAAQTRCTAGGKGVNVARALSALGCSAVCAGPLGGQTGKMVADAARRDGLAARWTWLDIETRTTTIVVDDDGAATVINEAGPGLGASDWERFVADIVALAEDPLIACISGSLPPGLPKQALARLTRALNDDGIAVYVDMAGEALAEALMYEPAGIKINAEEAGACLGRVIATVDDAVEALDAFRAHDVERACITLGAAGAVFATDYGVWRATPPAVAVRSSVGAGDSFLAGLLAARDNVLNDADALRLAVAVGAASVTSETPGLIDRALVEALRSAVRVTRLR